GDGPAIAPGENEKDLIAHVLADQAEEGARQIRRAPFARTRVHIKGEERVPMRLGEVGARHPIYLDAILQRAFPLAAYGLSLSGGKCAEEIVEALIAVVAPVELLIVALQEAKPAGKLPLLLCGKGDVQRGGVKTYGEGGGGLEQERLASSALGTIADQEPPAGDGRERHGALQLRIIGAAGAFRGVCPGVVEDIFAEGMRFQVARHASSHCSVGVVEDEMLWQPARLWRSRSALFDGVQKGVRDERVVGARRSAVRRVATGASV